ELLGKLGLELTDVRVLAGTVAAASGGLRFAVAEPPDRLFGLADAPALLANPLRELELSAGRPHAEQRARMPHVELAALEHLAHRLGQLEQAQQIADRDARAPDRFGRAGVGHL